GRSAHKPRAILASAELDRHGHRDHDQSDRGRALALADNQDLRPLLGTHFRVELIDAGHGSPQAKKARGERESTRTSRRASQFLKACRMRALAPSRLALAFNSPRWTRRIAHNPQRPGPQDQAWDRHQEDLKRRDARVKLPVE